jgi:hypothetical protein
MCSAAEECLGIVRVIQNHQLITTVPLLQPPRDKLKRVYFCVVEPLQLKLFRDLLVRLLNPRFVASMYPENDASRLLLDKSVAVRYCYLRFP